MTIREPIGNYPLHLTMKLNSLLAIAALLFIFAAIPVFAHSGVNRLEWMPCGSRTKAFVTDVLY